MGRIENLPGIPWSGLRADLITKLVNQGCLFTVVEDLTGRDGWQTVPWPVPRVPGQRAPQKGRMWI